MQKLMTGRWYSCELLGRKVMSREVLKWVETRD